MMYDKEQSTIYTHKSLPKLFVTRPIHSAEKCTTVMRYRNVSHFSIVNFISHDILVQYMHTQSCTTAIELQFCSKTAINNSYVLIKIAVSELN